MSSQQDFINYLKPYAQVAEAKYGIDWRIIVTQAALETGWGSTMERNPFNLWGMRFTGPAGVDSEGYALFSDQWEAVESYIYNLKKHHITAWEVRNNPEKFFQEIQSTTEPNTGAWAEDPLYSKKLKDVFDQYLSSEETAVDPTSPPQENIDTFPTYFPQSAKRVEKYSKDEEGAAVQQKRYYVKLQHVDADDEPQNALTFKIAPDSKLLLVKEKLEKTKEESQEESSDQQAKETSEETSQVEDYQVTEAMSLQFQDDGLLLDYHNNGGAGNSSYQKLTDQIQLRADYLALTRVKEGKKKKSESVILGEDLIQVEVNNDKAKSRLEILPRKILLKSSEGDTSDYVRIEDDTIQAKNHTGSQIFMKQDTITAINKTGTQVYMRGDYLELKTSGASIKLVGGTLYINAGAVIINGGSIVDVNAGIIELN
jgi:hypothetical protein